MYLITTRKDLKKNKHKNKNLILLGSWCYIKDLIKDNKNIKIMDNKIEKQDLMHKESKLIYEIYTNTIKDLTNFFK